MNWLGLGTGLTGFMQGFDQAQQQDQQRQLRQMQLQASIRALQQQQREQQGLRSAYQAAQALAANGGNPFALQQNTDISPSTPSPGQASMPNVSTMSGPSKLGATPGSAMPPRQLALASMLGPWSSDADVSSATAQSYPWGAGTEPGAGTLGTVPQTTSDLSQPSLGIGQQAVQTPITLAKPSLDQPSTSFANYVGPADTSGQVRPSLGPQSAGTSPGLRLASLAREVQAAGIPPADVVQGLRVAQPQARQTAVTAANQYPTQIYGGASLQQMAQAIDKANPGLDPAVKFLALTQLQKLMAPEEKMQLQLLMQQNRLQIAESLAQFKAGLAQDNPTGGTPLVVGGQVYNVRGNQATPVQGLPAGQVPTRIGATTPGGAKLDQDTLDSMADQYLAGDKSVLQGLGYGNTGAENRAALRAAIQKRAKAAGMSGADIAARIAEMQGIVAGERTLGTRAATLGLALNEAKAFVPLALDLSDKIDRTQFPTLNAIELAVEQGTGDENVARFNVANRSIISLYSQVLRRGGVPSDQSDREAETLLQKAYSQGQYRAAVDQIMKEAVAAQKAPSAVREELRGAITGKPTDTTAPPAQQQSQGQLPSRPKSIPKDIPDEMVRYNRQSNLWVYFNGTEWVPAKSD